MHLLWMEEKNKTNIFNEYSYKIFHQNGAKGIQPYLKSDINCDQAWFIPKFKIIFTF